MTPVMTDDSIGRQDKIIITTVFHIFKNLGERLNMLSGEIEDMKALKSTFQKWRLQCLRRKNALAKRNSKLAITEEKIHEPNSKINHPGRKIQKRFCAGKKKIQDFCEPQNNFKWHNIHAYGFLTIFLSMMKCITPQIWEAQWTPSTGNMKETRHIIIKLLKSTEKKKIFK